MGADGETGLEAEATHEAAAVVPVRVPEQVAVSINEVNWRGCEVGEVGGGEEIKDEFKDETSGWMGAELVAALTETEAGRRAKETEAGRRAKDSEAMSPVLNMLSLRP